MKKMIFAAVLAIGLLATTSVLAQDSKPAHKEKERPTAEQIATRKTDRMKEALSLTDVQYKEVYSLNLERIKQVQADREQMRRAKALYEGKIESALNPDQYKKFNRMQYAAHHKGHGGKKGYDAKKGMKNCDGCKDCGAKVAGAKSPDGKKQSK